MRSSPARSVIHPPNCALRLTSRLDTSRAFTRPNVAERSEADNSRSKTTVEKMSSLSVGTPRVAHVAALAAGSGRCCRCKVGLGAADEGRFIRWADVRTAFSSNVSTSGPIMTHTSSSTNRLPFKAFPLQHARPLQTPPRSNSSSPVNSRMTGSRQLSTSSVGNLPPAPSSITERFALPRGPKSYDASDIKNEDKLRAVGRDLRSDTLTVPTDAMFEAMKLASRGDDVYLEDETTTAFEESIALLAGKEAAIFLSSGTMSNQLAIRAHLAGPPHQILLDVRAHINRYESGGAAALAGAASTTVSPANGKYLTWADDVQPNLILDDDVHLAPTRLVCLENTIGGVIMPQDEVLKITEGVRQAGQGLVKLHLDGARLWNVAAETGISMAELAAPFDSVSLCLSKGLGAPMGTVLVGSKTFIHKVRHLRKMYGGGLRQTGPLAAAARVAVEEHFPRLKATHVMRQWLSDRLAEEGVSILSSETNMVWFDLSPLDLTPDDLSLACKHPAYLPAGAEPIRSSGNRLVIHHQTSPQALADFVEVLRRLKSDPHGVRTKDADSVSRGVYATR